MSKQADVPPEIITSVFFPNYFSGLSGFSDPIQPNPLRTLTSSCHNSLCGGAPSAFKKNKKSDLFGMGNIKIICLRNFVSSKFDHFGNSDSAIGRENQTHHTLFFTLECMVFGIFKSWNLPNSSSKMQRYFKNPFYKKIQIQNSDM